jgi:2-polyprenyl-3-methyl-5-hydroxy-6-metoxy-1,4-benzoquinol methylase
MIRTLEPEWLDTADASDPRARRSRRDLQLVHFMMGNATPVARALHQALAPDARIADLGGGDGRFMLRVARKLRMAANVTIIDRAAGVCGETLPDFEQLSWRATGIAADVLKWLERAPEFDAITANLFLHHLEEHALRRLMALASERTRLFIACEPRRNVFALAASRALSLLGCSPETRRDAAISVKAGFRGHELSEAWPSQTGWRLEERPSGLFSHLFIARRHEDV